MSNKLRICKAHPEARIPIRAYEHDAGLDLCSIEDIELSPGEHAAVGTGIKMAIPAGHVGLVWDKSGVAIKHGIKTKAGVIDSGYRGEIKIGLINLSNNSFKIEKGMKVAQILIQKVESPDIEEVEELSNSERGDKGFGSSGK